MNITLEKPLAILDLEATGLSITTDRIVEIAIIKIHPDGSETNFLKRVNPGIPIPAEVSAIHGIFDKDIADAPSFKDILPELEAFIEDADFAGYNSNKFDLPLLAEEMLRAESTLDISEKRHIDVQNIFHKMEQRTLVAALKFYCQQDLTDAHTAMADARATWDVLEAQLSRYDELKTDVDFLNEFSRHNDTERLDFAGRLAINKEGQATYNFGKHKGRTVKEVADIEPGYYGWMMDADFPLYTKQCLRKEMEKIKSERSKAKAQNKAKEEEQLQNKLEALKNKFK